MSTITAILKADADGTLHLPVPAELRNATVHGLDGAYRLGDLLRGPTLVVFLRHFG